MAGDGDSSNTIPAWGISWATGTDSDPRLELRLDVGPVTAVAFGVLGQRPWIASGGLPAQQPSTATGLPAQQPWIATGLADGRLLLGDALSGAWRELPCHEPVRSLVFAMTDEDPLLVSGHREGRLRIWGIEDGSLRRTIETGGDHLDQIHVSQSLLVTRDADCRVRCFSLPSGDPVPAVPEACAIDARGHKVLFAKDDGLSLWDTDSGHLAHLPVPADFSRVRSIALSTVDGLDCATVMDDSHLIGTLDLTTGALIAQPITAHKLRQLSQVMEIASKHSPHPPLAVVHGTLAVPTRWRVHLWSLTGSQQETAPLAGPVASSIVQAVRWQDRDLLLTASDHDGVVALWDIHAPLTRAPGHEQRVCQLVRAADDIVVSADDGGTIVARNASDGRLVVPPVPTGVEGTRALAAWRDGHGDILAAQGAGSRRIRDGKLYRWDVTTPRPLGQPVEAHRVCVLGIFRLPLPGTQDALVTTGPGGMIKLWRPDDGVLIDEIDTGAHAGITGFVAGVVDGRPLAVLSYHLQPMQAYTLDDPTAPPSILPGTAHDTALAMAGPHIIAARTDTPHALRAWHLDGRSLGAGLSGDTEVTSLACRTWPAIFVGRANGTVALSNILTGEDLCPPLHLPIRPTAMTVTPDGGLIVAFGSDLARTHPPA